MVYTLLVVDNNELIQDLLYHILGKDDDGCIALRVSDGPEALRLLESREVHLVIADNEMPDLSGIELTRKIAARWPDIAIVLLSDDLTEKEETDAIRAGASSVISKPFDATALLRLVRKLRVKSMQEVE